MILPILWIILAVVTGVYLSRLKGTFVLSAKFVRNIVVIALLGNAIMAFAIEGFVNTVMQAF